MQLVKVDDIGSQRNTLVGRRTDRLYAVGNALSVGPKTISIYTSSLSYVFMVRNKTFKSNGESVNTTLLWRKLTRQCGTKVG